MNYYPTPLTTARMAKAYAISIVGCLLIIFPIASRGQTTVFSDNFNRATGLGTNYTQTVSGVDWGSGINNNIWTLTNDASATANANGWVFSSLNTTTAFSSPYNAKLNANSGIVTWSFNMEQIRSDPAGFTSGAYGVAFVIGATSTTVATSGSGYAIVLGQSGTTDPVRFVSFSNGLQGTLTNLVTASAPLSDIGAEYLSLTLRYNPFATSNAWELFGRNDGSTAFADPTSGMLTSLGLSNDSTYTATQLTYEGAYWQGATATTQTALFDNLTVSVTPVPEPTTVAAGLLALGTLGYSQRRRVRWFRAARRRFALPMAA